MKTEHCLIFSRETFYITIVLCLNILWLKVVNLITARQTRTSLRSLRKHNVIKVCNIEYLTTQIELVFPTFKSRTVHKITVYLTLGLLSSRWNINHNTTAYTKQQFSKKLLKSVHICPSHDKSRCRAKSNVSPPGCATSRLRPANQLHFYRTLTSSQAQNVTGTQFCA